jgi:sugar phosphate isomerase/epimerase
VVEDAQDPRRILLREALLTLGQHGDRVGAVLALETGLESVEPLRKYLDSFDTGGLGANFDPANLMMHGFDVMASLRALRDKVVHIHAKDARVAGASRQAQEVPLGHGDIDWLEFVGMLEEFEYRGWLTVEREGGSDRVSDVAAGVKFLQRLVH